MTPILVHQRSTGRWFALTEYTVGTTRHPKTGRNVRAYFHRRKHDVTDQMLVILRAARRKLRTA